MSALARDLPSSATVNDRSEIREALPFIVLSLAFFARLILLAAHHGNADSRSFEDVAHLGNSGLYSGATLFNYAPGWGQVIFGIANAARLLELPFYIALGLLYLVSDIFTAFLLGMSRGTRAAVLFFANPVSILASSYYLQFDSLSILFLVMAVAASDLPRKATLALTTAFLSCSLLIKHITWFHPLLFVRGRLKDGPIRMLVPLVSYAVFAVSFVPYWRSWTGIKAQVIQYHSVSQDYGMVPRSLPFVVREGIFVIAVLTAVWLLRFIDLRRASLMTFLVVLLFIPGVWEYYFVWPIALGALCGGGVGYAVYSAVVTLFMLGSPDGFNLQSKIPHLPDWSGLWWASFFWLCWEVRRLRNPRLNKELRKPRFIKRRKRQKHSTLPEPAARKLADANHASERNGVRTPTA